MSPIEAASLYIGVLILLAFVLKANVGRVRLKTRTNLGDGDNAEMFRAIRVQGNAVEDMPFVVVGLLALALVGAPSLFIHGVGVVFVVSRVLHALGLGVGGGLAFGRMVGTVGSVLSMILVAGGLIYFAVAGGGV